MASGNYLSIINCLMQLRKVCNHPDLFIERAIMTSFPMEKSVVADFEIKELLVRRRLLREDPMTKASLEFLNLVPDKTRKIFRCRYFTQCCAQCTASSHGHARSTASPSSKCSHKSGSIDGEVQFGVFGKCFTMGSLRRASTLRLPQRPSQTAEAHFMGRSFSTFSPWVLTCDPTDLSLDEETVS